MTRAQAREHLLLYRGADHPVGAELEEALKLAREDPELGAWFREQTAFQKIVRQKFSEIEVPAGLREQIIAERKARNDPWLTRKTRAWSLAITAAAALIALLVILNRPSPSSDLAAFQNRMVGMTTRAYPRMDLLTNDLAQIRSYLQEHQAPADYALSDALKSTPATGCKVLAWHGRPISMVCFHSGKTTDPQDPDLFLFVIDRAGIKDTPELQTRLSARGTVTSATWTDATKVYVLAGVGDEEFLKKYL